MENVDVGKEKLCMNKVVGKKTDTFFIEGDVIIPDSKPDILNPISTCGNVCIYKKEVLDGKIKFDGTVMVYVMYLADSDKDMVRALNTSLDFSHIIEDKNCKSEMTTVDCIKIKSIECKVLNGRKINLKVSLEITSTIYANEETEMITKVSNIDDIQTLKENLIVNSKVGEGSTKAYAKETIVLDNTDNLAEILKAQIYINNQDFKISYNKILAKADANVKILYLTEDNEIKMQEAVIPIMGFIDMPNISEEHLCELNYCLSNLVIKPNSQEEHSIYIEAEINLSCMVYENKEVELIQDLYSPSKCLEFKQKEIKTTVDKKTQKQVCNIRQKIEIPEMENKKIYNVTVTPTINDSKITNGKIIYEGEIELEFLHEADNSAKIDTKNQKLNFDFTMELDNINKDNMIQTQIETIMQDFIVLSGGTIDVKIDLMFNIAVQNTKTINVINEMEVKEEENVPSYSMTIYFVKKGDTLWNIAKKFKSTVEDIARVNKIEDPNKIYEGEQLFIPRYAKTKFDVA